MTRWTGTTLIVAAALPLVLSAEGRHRHPTATETASRTACTITVKAENDGRQQVAISRDSQVRARSGMWAGPWKKLDLSVWIQPGQKRSWTYDLTFNCGAQRQYKFLLKKFDSNRNLVSQMAFYWPIVYNQAGWTTKTLIDLGDLNQRF